MQLFSLLQIKFFFFFFQILLKAVHVHAGVQVLEDLSLLEPVVSSGLIQARRQRGSELLFVS